MKKFLSAVIFALGILSTQAVTPGEWNTDFTSSWAYAQKSATPIVVVWGNTLCGYCSKLHAVLESETVMAWVKEHPVLLVSKYDPYAEEEDWSADYAAAEKWIRSLDVQNRHGYPYVGVYWKRADGTVMASTAFTGRLGKMPITKPKNSLAGQFVANLDALIGDFGGDDGISFVTADTENDRLEADSTTPCVYVPLMRTSSAKETVCTLVAVNPDGVSSRYAINWSIGEASKYVKVALPSLRTVGRQVSLSILNSDGNQIAASSITFVADQGNAPKNPHWAGEYDASSLPYGEWTMDFTTAKEKVARCGGKLLAMFGGPLWCPNCVAIEDDVFSTQTFKDWAKANKIVLVHFDQGRASSPATAEGTMQARLLTLTPSASSGASGASYLSRHGIDPSSSTVQAVIDRVTELTEAWLPPESTAARLGNPTVLLLNQAGTEVVGRFARQKDGYSMDLNENMSRLKALLLLADADESEGYLSTSPLTIAADTSGKCCLQVNAAVKYYRVTGVEQGYGLEVSCSEDEDVTVSVIAAGEEIATGVGAVSITDPLSKEQVGDLFVKVSSFSSSSSEMFGDDNVLNFELAVEKVEAVEVPFSLFTKSQLLAMNPSLFTRMSLTIPLFATEEMGSLYLAGTLALSISSSNRISAKAILGQKSISFSGSWLTISPSTGLVTTELSKKNAILTLTMDKFGKVTAEYREVLEGELFSGTAVLGDFTEFVGRYTVTLVDSEGSFGTGSLTINISKAGKAAVSGTMPNGVSVSVSGMLCANADGTATLPIWKTTSKGSLSLALVIEPDASATWGDEGNMDTVRALTDCVQTWTSGTEIMAFTIYGGYWEKGTSPLAICDMFSLSDILAVSIGETTNDLITATKSGFKLLSRDLLTSISYTKTTGVFSGKAKVVNSQGKSVSTTIKGVLLPGWIDCGCTGEPVVERPYGSGTAYYKDVIEGKSITVSIPVNLLAERAE